ncbi:MAG: Prefoldin subunit alpha [Promethearchaeota archaeon]|jgi:prefoldin alpha subunit|nr:MAG: Prefoldin subunit alpha [Candidatus Lokiarchaeota archaeon]
MENQQNYQQSLYQFRALREQREMFENQLQIVNASLGNLKTTRTTVENLKDVDEGEEILVPIGGIINVKAKIQKPEKVLLSISDDIVAEKGLDASLEFIEKLIEQHNEQVQYIQERIQKIDANLQSLSQTLQAAGMQGAQG